MNQSFPGQDSSAPLSQPMPVPAPQQVRIQMPYLVPKVTYAIIGFTVFAYLLQLLSVGLGYTFNGVDLLEVYGARINQYIRAGELWRFITPVFLHGSPTHIFFNMYALFSIGSLLEKHYGHARFALLYFLGAFSGNVFSFLFGSENGYSIGASTAVFGLITAEVVFFYQNRKLFGAYARQAITNTGVIIALNLFISLTPGIDGWGHVGGLLGGAMFAWFASPVWSVVGLPPEVKLEDQRDIRDWGVGTAVVFLVFGTMAIWGLFK
jgi:rhomboid protease GluP